ncbi:MAG: tagatose-6-phosphate kinase [Pedosphaera sp.]|nr:tagatose-6-phosphate kinase [Pedosphaera sp.]
MVLSGSLPQGLRPDAYAQLIRGAHRAGIKTILDCDGAALKHAILARPFLVKPNEHELAQWFGKPLRSEASILKAARSLSAAAQGWVVVSLGKRGAMLVNETEQVRCCARPPKVSPINTVGAGDAMVAAIVRQIELGASPQDWLRAGVAVGTAATQCAAGELPKPALIQSVLSRVSLDGGFKH